MGEFVTKYKAETCMMINSNSEHANCIFTHEVQFDFLNFIRLIFLVFQA